ncbi:unnamed protein product, partial [Ectocarpus sp. 12 AP-2014]
RRSPQQPCDGRRGRERYDSAPFNLGGDRRRPQRRRQRRRPSRQAPPFNGLHGPRHRHRRCRSPRRRQPGMETGTSGRRRVGEGGAENGVAAAVPSAGATRHSRPRPR